MSNIIFINNNKLKYKIIKSFDKDNRYESLVNECEKIIDLYKIGKYVNNAELYWPIYWIMPKDIKKDNHKLKISFDNSFIEYNNINIPSFMDNYLYINKNIDLINNYYIIENNTSYYYLFKNLYSNYLSKKKNINYLHINFNEIENKDDKILFLKNILENKNIIINIIELTFNDNKNKTQFKIKNNNLIYSEPENYNKIKLNNKIDCGCIAFRKYINDTKLISSDIMLNRLKYFLNFMVKNSNKGANYFIYFIGSYGHEFDNIICTLITIFNKVEIKHYYEKLNYNNTWIILTHYNPVDKLDFFEKRDYYDANSIKIKKDLYYFRSNLLIKTINKFNFLKNVNEKDFNLSNFKQTIINYMNFVNLPINILHNNLIEENNLKYHDMQLLIDLLNTDIITDIIEYKMTFNTFLYIVALYNQSYKKKIKYILQDPIIGCNDYLEAFSLNIRIKYDLDKIDNNTTISIFSNEYNNKYLTKYILINNSSLRLISNYSIYKIGKEYSIMILK